MFEYFVDAWRALVNVSNWISVAAATYIALLYVPVTFGFILLTTISRGLIYWQRERTIRVLCFFLVFFSLCFLYFVSSLKLPIVYIWIGRAIFFLAIAVGSIVEFVELVAFLRQKDAKHTVVAGSNLIEEKS